MNTTITKLSENIYAIDQKMVRCFIVIGEKEALIIDTGAIQIDFLSYVKKVTNKPIKLCLTHSDIDHITNLKQFDQVYLHKNELPILKVKKNMEIITIDNGFTFDLGNILLEVIHSAGHTPGSICLLDRKNKILFSGDTVSYGPVYMFGKNRDLNLYLETLKMLEKMAKNHEFNVIYPCHNSCPIKIDVIAKLIKCVEGVLNNTITGTIANLPFDMPVKPLLYKYDECGILYIKK